MRAIPVAVITLIGTATCIGNPLSTFDVDVEGWRVVSYPFRSHVPNPGTTEATWSPLGNPGGSIRVGDVYGETGVSAPSPFLTETPILYGKVLTYDIYLRFTDGVSYPAVVLNGGTNSVYFDRNSPSLDVWEQVTVPITEDGWKVSGVQAVASQEAFLSVLSKLQGLYAYTEWRTGPDDTNIDNIGIHGIGIGDFDANDMFTCSDVDALVSTIAGSTHDPTFDINGDGFVDSADLAKWLRIAGAQSLTSGNPYLPGDANLDGVVDGQDFISWNANKFTGVAAWCRGDFNADGVVDGQDFIIWNANKFTSSDSISAVPETCIHSLLIAAMLLASVSRTPRP